MSVHRFVQTTLDGVCGGSYGIRTPIAKKDLKVGDVVEIDYGKKLRAGYRDATIAKIDDEFRNIELELVKK